MESTHPFTQWLRTYLLWAYILGIDPQVFTSPSDKGSSVENNLRWQKDNLWVTSNLLDRISPRLLAILAVRNYLEQREWHRYLVPAGLSVALLVMMVLTILAYVRRLLDASPLSVLIQLMHLFIAHVVVGKAYVLLHDLARRRADDEAFERLSEPHLFLQAMETALEESHRRGETDKQLQKMLQRLNRLRARIDEPALTLQEVKQRVEGSKHRQEESPLAVNTGQEE